MKIFDRLRDNGKAFQAISKLPERHQKEIQRLAKAGDAKGLRAYLKSDEVGLDPMTLLLILQAILQLIAWFQKK